ncbi:MAG TPA: hypothetical protein VNF29_12780 [Candidatus Binataceae bacterium]|nr:hypothetical protein [Candidatus Binataceae bacterium]HVC45023.1 hypothetical protein [Candidatus Binataceae bacterium]
MELRLLTTEAERRAFAGRLSEVRMMRGAGFSETRRSVIGEVHLAFGNLYGLFDERSATPELMLGGFAMHDLGMFSQSYSKPDLTHLPPESVFECGELWAMAAGAGRLLRHAGAILSGVLEAQALLVYPILKPWNLSGAYKGFARIGEPIEWPYARTLEGGRIYVQAMVGEGAVLAHSIREASEYGYEVLEGGRRLRFDPPFSICTKQLEGRRRDSAPREVPAGAASANLAAA